MVMRLFNMILILALLLIPALGLSAQLEAVPDRSRVGLEESFTLELRASGSVDGSPDLSVLEEDFELLGRSQSSQVQIINGDMSRSTTWSLSLLARSAGSKLIPSLCIENDCSAPIAIEVLPAGQGSDAASAGNELLLEVSAEPDKVRVQSQLLYKVRLLTRLSILQASLSEPEPSGTEAVVQKLGDDRNFETERNGLRYRVIERSYAIFPQQSGRLTVPPLRFGAQVAEGGRSSFDPFNRRTRQLRKQSEAISVEVLPAAETGGRNWLPASDLQLEDDWQQRPPQLTVGEPATRTLTLRVNGLPAAQLPVLTVEIPDDVKSYPDQPNREDRIGESGVTGILQQKLALVPTLPGHLRLPEIRLDWWDLRAERWQQAILPAIDLEVLPAATQPEVAGAPPAAQHQQAEVDKPPPALLPGAAMAVDPGFWPWLSLVLGSGWLLTLLLLAKRRWAQSRKDNKKAPEEEGLSLKNARRQLQQALRSADQAQVRAALLGWGAALFPEQSPGNLEELAALCSNPLKQRLEAFSRSLYSRVPEPWDAQEMLLAIQQAEREAEGKKSLDQLPPLYPR